jgi:hypothetical protein
MASFLNRPRVRPFALASTRAKLSISYSVRLFHPPLFSPWAIILGVNKAGLGERRVGNSLYR